MAFELRCEGQGASQVESERQEIVSDGAGRGRGGGSERSEQNPSAEEVRCPGLGSEGRWHVGRTLRARTELGFPSRCEPLGGVSRAMTWHWAGPPAARGEVGEQQRDRCPCFETQGDVRANSRTGKQFWGTAFRLRCLSHIQRGRRHEVLECSRPDIT